ncbi:hypothetical protein PV721_39200 [Streptomyces sp. MB09-01]|nr:hypothetical protein [Streptomyces sp. MB09-01]MDX3540231.1 hypothetical protein [Streptomyces sp. MB09-01]
MNARVNCIGLSKALSMARLPVTRTPTLLFAPGCESIEVTCVLTTFISGFLSCAMMLLAPWI